MKLALIELADKTTKFKLIPDSIKSDQVETHFQKLGMGNGVKCICITGLGSGFRDDGDSDQHFQDLCQAACTLGINSERLKLEACEATSQYSFLSDPGKGIR